MVAAKTRHVDVKPTLHRDERVRSFAFDHTPTHMIYLTTLIVFLMAVAGCAPALTSKQARALAVFEECKQSIGAVGYELVNVREDGHFYIRGPGVHREALHAACAIAVTSSAAIDRVVPLA